MFPQMFQPSSCEIASKPEAHQLPGFRQLSFTSGDFHSSERRRHQVQRVLKLHLVEQTGDIERSVRKAPARNGQDFHILLQPEGYTDVLNKNEYIPVSTCGKTIGEFEFANRFDLVDVVIPSWVESIGDSAFFMCSNIRSVYIPESVRYIGDNAFGKCHSL